MTTRGNSCREKTTYTMKSLSHNILPLLLAATLLAPSCSSDDDGGTRPTPTGYDIYTAGHKTPGGKAVATLRENDTEKSTCPATATVTAKPIRYASYRATTDRQHRRNSDWTRPKRLRPVFYAATPPKRRQNKKLLLFLQENPKQTVTKSYGVQFQGDRAQVAAPLAGK